MITTSKPKTHQNGRVVRHLPHLIANQAVLIATFYYLGKRLEREKAVNRLVNHLIRGLDLLPYHHDDAFFINNDKFFFLHCFNPPQPAANDITVVQLVLNAADQNESAALAWSKLRQRLQALLNDEELLQGVIGYTLTYQAVLSAGSSLNKLTLADLLPNRDSRVLSFSTEELLAPLAVTDILKGRVWLLDIPLQGNGLQAATVYVAVCPHAANDEFVGGALYGPNAALFMPDLIAHKSYHQIRQYRHLDRTIQYSKKLDVIRKTVLEFLSAQKPPTNKFKQIVHYHYLLTDNVVQLNALRISLAKQLYNYTPYVEQAITGEIVAFHHAHLQSVIAELELKVTEAESVLQATNTAVNLIESRVDKERREQSIRIISVVLAVTITMSLLIDESVAAALLNWVINEGTTAGQYNRLQLLGVQLSTILILAVMFATLVRFLGKIESPRWGKRDQSSQTSRRSRSGPLWEEDAQPGVDLATLATTAIAASISALSRQSISEGTDLPTVRQRSVGEGSPPPPSIDDSPLASVSVLRGSKGSIKYEFSSGGITIGRSLENIIPLTQDPAISAKHAFISKKGTDFIIHDLGSSNGTSVNSERINERTLQDGDLISIGGMILRFEYTEVYRSLQELDESWSDWVSAIDQDNVDGVQKASKSISDSLIKALDVLTPSFLFSLKWGHVVILETGVALADTRLPTDLPLVYSLNQEPQRDDIEQLRWQLMEKREGSASLLLIVLPIESIPDQYKRAQLTWARSRSLDVVLISHDDIREILLYQDSRHALRRLITKHVQLSTLSPFIVTGPTTNTMFFGREQALREITEKSATASFALIGGRRIGKTSILLRLHRQRLPEAGFYTVYQDCSVIRTYEQFMKATIRDWQPKPPPNAPATFADLLSAVPLDKPLVMLLDEADKLVPADREGGWRLFNEFRALANSGRAHFVLSGERTLREALQDSTSPLFNLANEMLLGSLDKTAASELVTRPMKQLEIKLEDEETIIQRIYDFTAGHPNVVQRLCRRLLERLDEQSERTLSPEDVNAIIEDPNFQRDDFLNTYWQGTTLLERLISLLMVKDEKIWTLSTVREALASRYNLHPKARELDHALRNLVEMRSILQRTSTGYKFAVKAFPRVIAGTMTLDDMLEIFAEEYEEQNL